MTENNAAQPGLTDEEILDAIKAGIRAARDEGLAYAGPDNYVVAGAHALLSKLRAEGVQAGEPKQTQEYKLRAMAMNYSARHSWDHLDRDCVKAAADEIRALRAALASAPVAGEAQWPFAKPGTLCKGSVGLGSGCGICERCKEEKARLRASDPKNAAPEASEAVPDVGDDEYMEAVSHIAAVAAAIPDARTVRNAALEDAEEAVVTLYESDDPVYLPDIALAIRALKSQAQADKDGGDCAKGAGDKELLALMERAAREAGGSQWIAEGFESLTSGAAFYGGLIMNADGETIVAQCVNEPNASHMMSSSPANVLWLIRQYRAALPTPSVVKQSLTATQTGEKGEKDAH